MSTDVAARNHLNHLVDFNTDTAAEFRASANSVGNSEIETLFSNYAGQHARFAAELRDEIGRRGEDISDSDTLGKDLHRGWMKVKSAFTGDSVGSLLSACEDREQSAESAYLDAIEVISIGQTHTLLQKHCEQIKGFRTRLTRLVNEVKDGLEFPKNEDSNQTKS